VTLVLIIVLPVGVLLLAAVTRTRRVSAQRTGALPGGAAMRLSPGVRGNAEAARPRRAAARSTVPVRVSVVIPTLNEEGSLPWVLENLPPWVDEVVLVDGLSTDATQVLTRRIRPDAIVVHQFQRGKGAALRAGFAAATGDIVVMIDADGSTDPREMDRFVDALRDGADFVKGSRYVDGGGSVDFTRVRSAGNRTLVTLANVLYRSRFTDLCYGYCAFWRQHLPALSLTSDGFEIETELVLSALRARLEIREVPSFELERRAGVSNLNAISDGLRVLRTMFGRDERRDPGRIHFTLHPFHQPLWRTDRLPDGVDRRRLDRRLRHPAETGYTGPERRAEERRDTIGTVVAYRAVYDAADRATSEAPSANGSPGSRESE
jgi:hypothetical protein